MNKIAVVGIACLFPDAESPEKYWQNLLDGRDSTAEISEAQMGVPPAWLYDPHKGTKDRFYYLRGGYIHDFQFDPSGYRVPADDLLKLDRLFHWSLYVTREALRDSGYLDQANTLAKTGIILGNLSFPTPTSHALISPIYHREIERALRDLLDAPDFDLIGMPQKDAAPENIAVSGYPAGLAAQALGLGALNLCLDAACASSLYAVKFACDVLNAGQADMMLAGAVSASDPYNISMGFSIFQAYPEPGAGSHPLDQASKGLTAAEGAGMFVLKRYDDAVRDGDKIYATILGAGLSNDGRGKHLLSPNSAGQILAFERAYQDIDPQSIDYLECHATGTPLGDATEMQSIQQFFGDHLPLLGSAKSNFGHLLTAAGMAGMIKVIYSLAHQVIPATIHIDHPLLPQVVTENTQWEGTRAAVDAFGFGGTNAHLIMEGTAPHPKSLPHSRRSEGGTSTPLPSERSVLGEGVGGRGVRLSPLAIVGMDAYFGNLDGLGAFQPALYKNEPAFTDVPAERWKGIAGAKPGAYIEGFDLDFLYFKTPPAEQDQVIPQQLLMLKVADRAIKDAGLAEGSNVAVLIAMGGELALHLFRERVDLSWQIKASLERAGLALNETDLKALEEAVKEAVHEFPQVNQYVSFIGNIIASRISSRWDFSGASFTISSEENSVFKALHIAQLLLSTSEVEAVVVGGVDLAGGVENVLLRAGDVTVGEGAGAVVLKRLDQAADDRVYAVIESLETFAPLPLSPTTEGRGIKVPPSELGEGFRVGGEVSYVEIAGGEVHNPYPAEIDSGSVRDVIGYTYTASGIASLIKVALALHHRYLPGQAPIPWLAENRAAAILSTGMDGTQAQVVVTQAPLPLTPSPNALRFEGRGIEVPPSDQWEWGRDLGRGARSMLPTMNFYLFPLSGNDLGDLLDRVEELEERLIKAADLKIAATQTYQQFDTSAQYRLVIVGSTLDELRREIQKAWVALQKEVPFETPLGSVFTLNPVRGEIAFVYPGALNGYAGMGRDLLYLFPDLYARFEAISSDLARSFSARYVYNRYESAEAMNAALLADNVSMIQAGASLATLYTHILRDYFKVQPDAAFGYSMGESSMMWSLDIWRDADTASQLLHESALFKARLFGEKQVVAENLGIPGDQWVMLTLKASFEAVQAQLADHKLVFIALINTPNEVVIAGDRTSCQQVIAALGCEAFPSPANTVIHCPPMRSEYDALVHLHTLPVFPVEGVRCYSASTYAPMELTSEAVAAHISEATCAQIDFPRLIEQAYADGCRIFIELGARSTCTRWISEVLKGRDHLAIAINRPRVDDHLTLIRLLAKLVAHNVPLDLAPLYAPLPEATGKTLIKKVKTGGKRIYDTLVTPENRARFQVKRTPPLDPLPLPREGAGNGVLPADETIFLSETDPVGWQRLTEANESIFHPTPLPRQGEGIGGGVPSAQSQYLQHEVLSLATENIPDNAVLEPVMLSGGHVSYLQAQHQIMRQYADLVQMKLQTLGGADNGLKPIVPTPSLVPEAPGIIWDEADLLEFAEGSIAKVFGEEYAIIDQYARRVRLPMPPYLLVSRVTKLDAERGVYRPSSMTTEYDIPHDHWYLVDGQIPWAVSVESGQCDLLLISYIGIDFENKGEYVYRLLDCTITFLDDMQKAGDTLRYDIKINSYAQSGNNLLFFFSYECFVGDKMVLKMTNGCAGFFSDEQLAEGKGVIYTAEEIAARNRVEPRYFMPFLRTPKTTFDHDALLALTRGDVAACFGKGYQARGFNPSLRLPLPEILMLDRIASIDPQGGAWGLGLVVAEKDLRQDDWYFPCHFKDDQVMAGSLMAEGCGQLLQFYLLYLGMQTQTLDARFQPIPGLPQVVRCRGQVTPTTDTLIYRMEVTDIGTDPAPYAKANIEIILQGKVVVHFKDLALQLVEKDPSHKALYHEHHIEEFALGSIPACFGEDYDIYHTRQTPRTPNGALKLINRITEVNASRLDFAPGSNLLAEYDVPAEAWYYADTGTMPYSILMEIGLQPCGFLSALLGSTLLFPDERLYFRNLDGDGALATLPDLRGKTIQNRVRLISSTALQGFIIQNFAYELSCEGIPFYSGTASFGYFSQGALANQVGLDQGQDVRPWYEDQNIALDYFDQTSLAALEKAPASKPFYRLAGDKLHFLDEVWVGEQYIFASKLINAQDWFYACHFHEDPVMPGSLGVEALLEAMQVYALAHDLGGAFKSPRFAALEDHQVVWKYRGQITPENQQMYLEVQITAVEQRDGKIVILGDASLWKDNMRIYEVRQIGLQIVEGY